ncbi:hypothetical protein JZN54_004255 [Vibrio vulnificus]|nr:hypothetical protein [Vibrio vulnificus]
METNANLLSDHIVSSNQAMEVLFKNKHHESALILLYSWVDRLAWLSVDAEESNGGDFKQWLNRWKLFLSMLMICGEQGAHYCTQEHLKLGM